MSVVVFAVGSVLCGAAQTIDTCIVGRVISGVGGLGMYLGVMNIVSSLTTDKERPGYIGFVYKTPPPYESRLRNGSNQCP